MTETPLWVYLAAFILFLVAGSQDEPVDSCDPIP
jgi:hypothetical protein